MFKIASLFFADDGTILARSIKEAGEVTDETTRVIKKYGLEISKCV